MSCVSVAGRSGVYMGLLALVALSGCVGNTLPSGVASVTSPTKSPAKIRSTGSTFYGCPAFRDKETYNKVITNAKIDPDSQSYIDSVIQAGDTYGFYASTGIEQINLADNSTRLHTVKPKSKYHEFPDPYPWQTGYYIEPGGDAHAMVVQTKTCRLYEAYSTSYVYDVLSAYSGANWHLKRRFVPLPAGSPSAMSSGLSIFAGIVRWDDYESGSIDHALNWDGIAHTVSQYGYVRPASATDRLPFYGNSSYQMPWGARIRLKASFSTYGWGPQSTMVANALKTYGAYLADTGSSANGLYFANAEDGTNPWDWADLSALGQITMDDFDVIKLPPIQYVQ
jgi:hypothetical protein